MPAKSSRLLWWDGKKGLAYFAEVHAELPRVPRVPGMDVELIDYAPEVGLLWVRERGGAWRDLNAAEQQAVDTVLGRMANKVLQEVC